MAYPVVVSLTGVRVRSTLYAGVVEGSTYKSVNPLLWPPSLMYRLLVSLFSLMLASMAVAADLPPDVSREPWFMARCQPLAAHRVSTYGGVKGHQVVYAWKSDSGYLWDWERGVKAAHAAHYCTRLVLYGQGGRVIENMTMICSVSDHELPTEVWMFGNRETADRLCPMDAERLKDMDGRARHE